MFSTKRIAIDLGTSNTVLIVEGQGIVINEPTVVAVSTTERRLIAVGQEAKDMLGKVPKDIEARRPLQNGGIANYRMTEALLRKLIDKALTRSRFIRPEVIVSVPAGLSSVEERAVVRALNSAGAGKIYLLPEPVAAALGAGMPIHTSSGNFIVNMGGGTSEIAMLSLNGLVESNSVRIAGDAINQSIMEYLKKQRKMLVGENVAEDIKMKIGYAIDPASDKLEVTGVNSKTGLPEVFVLESEEIVTAIRDVLNKLIAQIQYTLEKVPPDLAADVVDRGIVLSGGTALLKNIDVLFTKALGVPAHVVDDPLMTVARGLIAALNNLDVIKRNSIN